MVLRAKEWPPTGEAMDSGKGLDRCATQDTRVQVRRRKGRSKKKKLVQNGLKQDNVATFGATSRRSREEIFQRRDIEANVATFQRMCKINVAMLDTNVATF